MGMYPNDDVEMYENYDQYDQYNQYADAYPYPYPYPYPYSEPEEDYYLANCTGLYEQDLWYDWPKWFPGCTNLTVPSEYFGSAQFMINGVQCLPEDFIAEIGWIKDALINLFWRLGLNTCDIDDLDFAEEFLLENPYMWCQITDCTLHGYPYEQEDDYSSYPYAEPYPYPYPYPQSSSMTQMKFTKRAFAQLKAASFK